MISRGRTDFFSPSIWTKLGSPQNGQKRNNQSATFWRILECCLSTTLKKVRQSIATVTWTNCCVWIRKSQKTTLYEEGISALSPRPCIMSQFNKNYAKQREFLPHFTIFARFGPHNVLPAFCRQKHAWRKVISDERTRDCRKRGIFSGQR